MRNSEGDADNDDIEDESEEEYPNDEVIKEDEGDLYRQFHYLCSTDNGHVNDDYYDDYDDHDDDYDYFDNRNNDYCYNRYGGGMKKSRWFNVNSKAVTGNTFQKCGRNVFPSKQAPSKRSNGFDRHLILNNQWEQCKKCKNYEYYCKCNDSENEYSGDYCYDRYGGDMEISRRYNANSKEMGNKFQKCGRNVYPSKQTPSKRSRDQHLVLSSQLKQCKKCKNLKYYCKCDDSGNERSEEGSNTRCRRRRRRCRRREQSTSISISIDSLLSTFQTDKQRKFIFKVFP
ncbi:uncharacterized protein LOC117123555 [Anneissia japonica]|uniref:uncharacterized protein LOC117123555 n=1 Tax=Anneissia japonica TaxID=1529436 RepID=UPI001425B47B|nr:uncharacterized protein LOC117123555 [Anneissia japonica]